MKACSWAAALINKRRSCVTWRQILSGDVGASVRPYRRVLLRASTSCGVCAHIRRDIRRGRERWAWRGVIGGVEWWWKVNSDILCFVGRRWAGGRALLTGVVLVVGRAEDVGWTWSNLG